MAKFTNLENADDEGTSLLDELSASFAGDDERPETVPVKQSRNDPDDEDETDDEEDGEEEPDEQPTKAKAKAKPVKEDTDSEEDDSTEEDNEASEPESATKPNKVNSKEDAKIVALKRENKRLAEQNRQLAAEKQKQDDAKNRETLIAQYKEKGYDDDVAARNADSDVRMGRLETRLELQDFREENYEVLRQYPDAKADLQVIMQRVKATGMTAEEICRGMYGQPEPAADSRARAAAKGQSTRSVEQDDTVSSAMRGSARQESISLSLEQQAQKRFLENVTGRKYSDKEFMSVSKKHNLRR